MITSVSVVKPSFLLLLSFSYISIVLLLVAPISHQKRRTPKSPPRRSSRRTISTTLRGSCASRTWGGWGDTSNRSAMGFP